MTYDTTKDPRIIVALSACSLLKKCIKQKLDMRYRNTKIIREKLPELVSTCESAVMSLMYMYQEPSQLATAQPLDNLEKAVQNLIHSYEKMIANKDDVSMLRAQVRWCLRILAGLRARFANPGKTLASGVDLVSVQVRNAAKDGPFIKTRVTDGSNDYAVMTNLTNVKTNFKLAAAFLPPRVIGGTVSEAMFLGGEQIKEEAGTMFNEEQVDASDAASILYSSK